LTSTGIGLAAFVAALYVLDPPGDAPWIKDPTRLDGFAAIAGGALFVAAYMALTGLTGVWWIPTKWLEPAKPTVTGKAERDPAKADALYATLANPSKRAPGAQFNGKNAAAAVPDSLPPHDQAKAQSMLFEVPRQVFEPLREYWDDVTDFASMSAHLRAVERTGRGKGNHGWVFFFDKPNDPAGTVWVIKVAMGGRSKKGPTITDA
jgi:hypothetical protein